MVRTNAISRSRVARRRENKKNGAKELPEEIISEILSRLPAKSLCKFKCCSKSISELITKKTYFAQQQSQNSLLKDDSYFFIQGQMSHQWEEDDRRTEIHALPGEDASSCGVPTNFLSFLHERSVRILASSNGLLLCQTLERDTPMQLFICNPTTQSCSFIPIPHNHQDPYAFAVFAFECNNSEDYKLLVLEKNMKQWSSISSLGCKIYMPKEGVWKARERSFYIGDMYMRFDLPVFHKGALHFISRWSAYSFCKNGVPYMASYNLESGISRMLKIPEEAAEFYEEYYHELGIFKWGKAGSSNESICFVRLAKRTVFTVWALTHYESSCWSKILTISLNQMWLRNKNNSTDFVLTVMNGDSLVFGTKKKVYRYDLIGERKKRLEPICEHKFKWQLHLIPYSSTLRSCGPGAIALP